MWAPSEVRNHLHAGIQDDVFTVRKDGLITFFTKQSLDRMKTREDTRGISDM